MKGITAANPLKKKIVAALKDLSGGTKVTCVTEDKEYYYGKCMGIDDDSMGRGHSIYYKDIGIFKILKSEIKDEV